MRSLFFAALHATAAAPPPAECDGEVLASGICLGKDWPPIIQRSHKNGGGAYPPYLLQPPALINITSNGRQLFVDSFLIDDAQSAGIGISYHDPVYRDDVNPVLYATEPWEKGANAADGSPNASYDFASPYSGGVWHDPSDQLYKMWYSCGRGAGLAASMQCMATSSDGIEWSKPKYDVVNGTNIVGDGHTRVRTSHSSCVRRLPPYWGR